MPGLLHRNINGIADDELDLIVVIAAVRSGSLDIGAGHHKGKAALGDADVVVEVAIAAAIKGLGEVAVVVADVQTDPDSVRYFETIIRRQIISAARVNCSARRLRYW